MIERKFIQESIKRLRVKDFVEKELEKAGVVNVEIQKTTLATRIGIVAERPGLVIGRKGGSIKSISESLQKNLGIENPQIEVADVSVPNLEPTVMAGYIKRMVERGIKRKRVMQTALSKIMAAGAMGAEIVIDGPVSRGGRSRKERISAGYMKKAGDSVKLIKKTQIQAKLKLGVLGITVKIVPPDVVFPDKIIIKAPEVIVEDVEEETTETPTKVEEKTEEVSAVKDIAEEVKPQEAEKETAKEALKEVAEETIKEAKKEPVKEEKPKAEETKKPEVKETIKEEAKKEEKKAEDKPKETKKVEEKPKEEVKEE